MNIRSIEDLQKLVKTISEKLRGTEFQDFCIKEMGFSYSSFVNKMNGNRKWKIEEILAICENFDIEILAVKKLD